MAVAARTAPRAPTRPAAAPGRAPVPGRAAAPHAPAPHAAHHPAKSQGLGTGQILGIAAGIVVAAVVGLGVIWQFGAARDLSMIGGLGGGATARPQTTTMYRDMKDGRLMVIEIGPEGTRIKGTVDKASVAIANEEIGQPRPVRRPSETSSRDRVNALGSSFR